MGLPTHDRQTTRTRFLAGIPRRQAYSSPPGQLVVLLVALVVLCLGAGVAGAFDVQHRRAALNEVIDRGGPLTGAAMDVYQSLSEADATVAGAYLVGDVEPAELRDRYRTNIAEASAALGTAALAEGTEADLTALNTHLPVYTGLIETARTLNRQGLPQGVAYLREASTVAQTVMLPAAERLLRQENTRLLRAQQEASSVDPVVIGAAVLVVLALLAAQVHLARTTRRIFNAGLLAATLCAVAAVAWLVTASVVAAAHAHAGRTEGTAQVAVFSDVRAEALKARCAESLILVARGNGTVHEADFDAAAARLSTRLLADAERAATASGTRDAVRRAGEQWSRWLDGHKALREKDDNGEFGLAVKLATSADEQGGTTGPSRTVDEELGKAIEIAKERFETESAHARNALAFGEIGVAVLMALAALGVGFGYLPRLREYR
ncbi:hypothetical protein PV646_17715 [Streptomyces sp. ID05-26A]|nr:hypothetical protein [Streptomyces sp. ID05-26A]